MLNDRGENDIHESFKLGSAVANMFTSYWNSPKNPSRVYVFNRRVHHGAIGALLGLSTLYKKIIQLLLVFCQCWVQVFNTMITMIPKNGSYLRKKRMMQMKINK